MSDTPQLPTGSVPPSARRRVVLWLLLLLIAYALVELCSFACFWMLRRHPFSFAALQAERAAVVPDPAMARPQLLPAHLRTEVLHPYLGYVKNPDAVSEANRFGFLADEDLLHRRSADTLIVGITGGSVALNFARQGTEALGDALRAAPRWRGKEIRFVNLAISGYKQPQQLMSLSYLLALGGELDLLINIDGFNDIALYAAEDPEWLVSSLYPREWRMRIQSAPDPVILLRQGEIIAMRLAQERWAEIFARAPLRHSVTANLLWKIRHEILSRAINGRYEYLRSYHPEEMTYECSGPPRDFDTPAQMYTRLAELWQRCSLAMDGLCQGSGVAYYHFLQPNQYVAGAKPMGAEERARACLDAHPYRSGVEQGYPLLEARGAELLRRGVRFHSLTTVFASCADPLYTDTCCHFNRQGNEIVARAIAAEILARAD